MEHEFWKKSRAPLRREQIVTALYDCLSRMGHEKVTVKEIAKTAGLPHGVIHYYFNSKDEIVGALLKTLESRYTALLSERIRNAFLEKKDLLKTTVDYLLDQHVFDVSLNRVFYNLVQMAFEREHVAQSLQKALQIYRDTVRETLHLYASETDIQTRAALLVAMVEGLALQWMIEPDSLDWDQIRPMLIRAVRNQSEGGKQ